MAYKCNLCKSNLKHLDGKFWLCENCNSIIEIEITKNWKGKLLSKKNFNKINSRQTNFKDLSKIHTGEKAKIPILDYEKFMLDGE